MTKTSGQTAAGARRILPEEVHGTPVVGITVCYSGPLEESKELVAPIKRFGRPLADSIGLKPFVAHQQFSDSGQPFGRRYHWKSDYFDALPEAAEGTMIEHARAISAPHSAVLCMHLGGAAARRPEDRRRQPYRRVVLNLPGAWEEPAEDDARIAWARDFWSAMQPFSSGGTYVNFLTQDADEDPLRAAYGPELYAALARVKAKYDPDNLFRSNQNIRPAASAGTVLDRAEGGGGNAGPPHRAARTSAAYLPWRRLTSRGGPSSPTEELRIGLRAWWGGRQADHPCVPGRDAGVLRPVANSAGPMSAAEESPHAEGHGRVVQRGVRRRLLACARSSRPAYPSAAMFRANAVGGCRRHRFA